MYLARMVVDLPHDLPDEERTRLLADEREYSQQLQRSGEWVGLWRVVGRWANVSLFDVADHDRLHELLVGLPLYPYLTIDVTPLATHPSWLGGES